MKGEKIGDRALQQELSRLREFRNHIERVWLIGSQIASLSASGDAVREMMNSIFDLTQADSIEVILKRAAGFEYLTAKKGQGELMSSLAPFDELQKLAELCANNGQEIIIYNLEQEYYQYLDYFDRQRFAITPDSLQTLLYFPLMLHGESIGALSIQFNQQNRTAFDMRIAYRLLAQFVTIGFTNMHRLLKLSKEKDILAQAAARDALTGLLNRRAITERTTTSFMAAKRHKLSCYIVIFDIDHFKLINDTWGHITGDQVIRHISSHARKVFKRKTDHIGRLGGDEFIVMLTDTSKAHVLDLAETLRQEAAAKTYVTEKGEIHLTISLGVSGREPTEEYPARIENILEEADKALYQAKHLGRNRCEFYEAETP
jgi:diguanylate cyclase (GGDEF)-like protein